MKSYDFSYNNQTYQLSEEKCTAMYNDETHPISDLSFEEIVAILEQAEDVSFQMEYYDVPCEVCKGNHVESSKNCSFLEYHFYLFTKDSQFVISSISKDYEANSFTELSRKGLVDESYLLSILVCPKCLDTTIELTYCDF